MSMHLILALVTSLLQAFATGNQPECEIYLAPSLTPGMGRGVFAGTPLAKGGILENSVTLAVRHLDISHWQLNNYVWATDDDETSLAELGVGMLHNHNNPPTISHLWPSHFKSASEQQQSHTTYSTLYSVAQRDIAAGEEIFVSYSVGNTWLEQRGIIVEDIPEKDVSAPPVRSAEELKSIGICMTDVKVKKSSIPLAGKGLFAAKDFKSGDIITVSPTLIFPKESVSSVGADRKTIIQNYCIASEGVTNIALFPFGLGNMANHARSDKSNMELEWFWWSDEEKQNKLGTSTADLMAAPFAQVDIAYRASRDISEGEELTVDYGEDWANKWALHLASLNQWYLNSAARDLAEEDHNPPDAVVKGSEKPRFLAYMASENLFSPAWRAESDALEVQAAAVARMAAKLEADQLAAEIANEAAVVAAAAEENGGVTAPVMVLPDADEDRSLSSDAAAQTTPVDMDIELLMA